MADKIGVNCDNIITLTDHPSTPPDQQPTHDNIVRPSAIARPPLNSTWLVPPVCFQIRILLAFVLDADSEETEYYFFCKAQIEQRTPKL